METYILQKISCSRKQKEDLDFTLAWALQDSGNIKDANQKWLRLTENNDFYIKSAAVYFYGKNLLDQGNREEALKMFKKVSGEASKSKYATYCWNLVSKLEAKK